MKKILFLVISLFVMANIQSQELDLEKIQKNEIDLVLSDLINGSITINYERLISEHFSVSLGLGYKGENGLIVLSGLDTEKIKTNEITYSGFKIIPEVRYYLNNNGHTNMTGFYFGAYLKYSNYQSDLNGRYIDEAQETFDVKFDADLDITSIGLMIGYKLPVSKRFTIDFLIAGPGNGAYKFSFKNKGDDLPDEFYDDLNEALENYSIFDALDGDFRFSTVRRRSNFNRLSLRYGISLGYRF